ncbi:hypothetical protein E2553_34370 [Paraburkholderia dipogonis]|uniref:DUF4386 domain-containing protein n=1 Tax=Paraburkholderia dipogonis TaxID=1211383 RepID=A0A4Y8MW45_9BURK|nr:hypothetical protein [Paraburkholderia dipogonis]TFE41737.1 hypothetical protein E2553_34370 [Paraburkholderia dipogonis]
MTQHMTVSDPRRFVGWLAVIGAVLAWSMAVLYAAAANFDFEVLERPVAMLGFTPGSQNLFRLSMWADILGWYLPFLAVGGYLWGRMRQRVGALADIALTGVVAYAMLGIIGAGMLNLTLAPLAGLHSGNDPMARAAAEAIWPTLQNAAQGIWNAEAPFLLLWGIGTARFLRAEKWSFGRLLTFDLCVFGIEFILNLSGWQALAEMALQLTLVIHPLWLFLFGISLLRERAPALAGTGMAPAA